MKQKQIKIYSFVRRSIAEGAIASENLDENVITITESFLTRALECYKNAKIENDQLINEIIKVILPQLRRKCKRRMGERLNFQ